MRIRLLLAAAFAAFATNALAWNNHGHMLVAAVAWRQLTPAARIRVGELLRRNPLYETWTSGVPEERKTQVAFIRAATWPDVIKGDPLYVRDRISSSGPLASQNVGYVDHLQHDYWHFRDEPFSPDGAPLQEPETPNAMTQIEAFRAALRSHASDDVKSYDLVWLEHLIGDVHQPLHATSRFTHDAPQGDRGGNSVKLCDQPDCRFNLHSLWDGALGREDTVESAIAEAEALPTAPKALARIRDERVWFAESVTIAKNTVYAPPVGPATGPYAVTARYEQTAREVARGRAALAGARLAAVINRSFR